jgi:hypothetical protein
MLLLVEQEAGKESQRVRSRLRGLIIAQARKEIVAAGAGTKMPEFKKK